METDKIKLIDKIKSINFSEPEKIIKLIEPVIVSDFKITEIEKQGLINQIKELNFEDSEGLMSFISSVAITDSNPSQGLSKFGGTPDFPPGFKWPYFKDKPMVFFAQINLDELKDLDIENILPKKGILYFFSYFENPGQFGAECDFLKNKEEYKVLFYEGNITNLNKVNFPKDLITEYHFKENIMSFMLAYQVPSTVETWKLEKALLSENDLDLYRNFIYNESFPYDSILGTPKPIQYGVDYSWADSCFGLNSESEEIKTEKQKIRSEFVNILSFEMGNQFDSIGGSNCYFGIRKVDLLEKNFDNVIFVMQDT